jgi:hypothetical protein
MGTAATASPSPHLPIHRAGCQPRHELHLQQHEEHDDRQDAQQREALRLVGPSMRARLTALGDLQDNSRFG